MPTSKELYEMLKADPEAMKHFLEVTEPIWEKMEKHRKQFWERERKKFLEKENKKLNKK